MRKKLLTHGCISLSTSERAGLSSNGSFTLPTRYRSALLPITAAIVLLLQNTQAQNAFVQRDLVSDIPGRAEKTDTNLLNPWGITFSATSPFWISDNHSGKSTLYDSSGTPLSLVVTVPTAAGGTPPGSPTGIIFNGTTNFGGARFIFATEDGTISGWTNGANAQLKVDNSLATAVYKGLASGTSGGNSLLFAANFHSGRIDIFDANYAPVLPPGAFLDPTIPIGFAPFNVQNIGGQLYVMYAKQDATGHDDVPGPGNGFVNIFTTGGALVSRFASSNVLNSPWGIAKAPAGFGPFSGAILIGNFGDGRINAFDATTGAFLDTLKDAAGTPISIQGLWALAVGNGGSGGDANTLYFTAGIAGSGALEDHGLFGSLTPVQPTFLGSANKGLVSTVRWAGGVGPFLLQRKVQITDASWVNVMTTSNRSLTIANDAQSQFFRVQTAATNLVWPFTASLSAANENPVNASTATGVATLSLEGSNLSYYVSFSGLLSAAIAGHIHAPAFTTNNASVQVPFNVPAATSGIISGSTIVSADIANNIFNGKAYVNIHTTNNPGGEIRGQVVPLRMPVTLSGAAETPPISPAGTGSGTLTLVGNQALYDINYSGLTSAAILAHIHGPAGTTNATGVLVPLATPSGTSGNISGTVSLDSVNLNYLLLGLTYVNIHTITNGGGEIRGQIWPYQLGATIDGPSEVPVNPSSGTGTGTFMLAGGTLFYNITFTNLGSAATAAHIHAPADSTHLANPAVFFNPPAATFGTMSDISTLTSPVTFYLMNRLGYVNIHTVNNGGGEIRGQVMPKY